MLGDQHTNNRSIVQPEKSTVRIEEAKLQKAIADLLAQKSAKGTGQLAKEQRNELPILQASAYGLTGQTSHFIVLPRDHDKRRDIPWLIEFQGMGAGCAVMGIRVLGDVVLGISKPGTAAPDLDLSRFDAEQQGVSRRHAVLRPGRNCLYLIDLQSTNGTRVNAMPVTPGMARELHNLDTISLGALSFTVKILATPEQLVSHISARNAAV
jgi:hypothetical protein